MAYLSGPYDAKRKDGRLIAYPLAGGGRAFKGALVCVNSASGFVSAGGDAAGYTFVGVAYESVDNTGGANGAKSVRVEKGGSFTYAAQGAAPTDVGKPAFLIDDNTVKTAATANSIAAGVVVSYLSPTQLVIRIDGKVN